MTRVLIVTASYGSCHNVAARCLAAQTKIVRAAVEVAAGHHHRRSREGVDVSDGEKGVEERREEGCRQQRVADSHAPRSSVGGFPEVTVHLLVRPGGRA